MSRIQDELKTTFGLASLQHEAKSNLNHDEWREFAKIKDRHDEMRRFVKRSYEMDHPELVAKERRRIINQEGQKKLDFKSRLLGRDAFEKDSINRRAHNRVQQAYRRDLAQVDQNEAADLRQILNRSEARQQLREKPKQDFARAVDRRSGQDRRRTMD